PKNCFFGVRLQFLNPHLQLVNSGLKILSALKNRVFRSSLRQKGYRIRTAPGEWGGVVKWIRADLLLFYGFLFNFVVEK
ncbi:MAG: hypothetical protein LBR10_04535, partial [Prevotellaceae bacterium]|nr:hypothetical protein [Prevotellaceae bacterium]